MRGGRKFHPVVLSYAQNDGHARPLIHGRPESDHVDDFDMEPFPPTMQPTAPIQSRPTKRNISPARRRFEHAVRTHDVAGKGAGCVAQQSVKMLRHDNISQYFKPLTAGYPQSRSKSPPLPQRTRQGWGTQISSAQKTRSGRTWFDPSAWLAKLFRRTTSPEFLLLRTYSFGLRCHMGSVGFQVWTSFSKFRTFGPTPAIWLASRISAMRASSRFRSSGLVSRSTISDCNTSPRPSQSGHFSLSICSAMMKNPSGFRKFDDDLIQSD